MNQPMVKKTPEALQKELAGEWQMKVPGDEEVTKAKLTFDDGVGILKDVGEDDSDDNVIRVDLFKAGRYLCSVSRS